MLAGSLATGLIQRFISVFRLQKCRYKFMAGASTIKIIAFCSCQFNLSESISLFAVQIGSTNRDLEYWHI